MGHIEQAYKVGERARYQYQQAAVRNQKYTMMLGVGWDGLPVASVRAELFSDIGARIVRSLASTLISVAFPSNVDWVRLDMRANNPELAGRTDIITRLAQGDRAMMQLYDDAKLRSMLWWGFVHALECGQVLAHLREEDEFGPTRLRLTPLDRHVTFYQDGHQTRAIAFDSWREDPADPRSDDRVRVYTDVNHITGQVTQEIQTKDDPGGKIVELDDESAVRWFTIGLQQPMDSEHFAGAYTSDNITSLIHANGFKRAFRDIVYDAAVNPKAVKVSSGLTPYGLDNYRTGQWLVVNDEGDIFYPRDHSPLVAPIQFLLQAIDGEETKLERAYLVGLLDRRPAPQTATEVVEIVSEQESTEAHFYAHIGDHVQPPLANAMMDVLGFRVRGPNGMLRPAILTGLAALSKQQESRNFLELLTSMKAIDEEFVRLLPMGQIFQMLANGLQIDTSGINPVQVDVLDAVRQLMAVIVDNPAEAIPVLQQVLSELPPQVQQAMAGIITQQQVGEAPATTVEASAPAALPPGSDAAA